MLFNSWQYAFFFVTVFALYWAIPYRFRWGLLFITSYYFYMSWNAKYVVLILFTTFVSYISALLIEKQPEKKKRKEILLFSLILCLAVLFVFKYLNFFFESINAVTRAFSIPFKPFTVNFILPVGISFYTFQTLSYVIDVYQGTIEPEKNFGIYATFVSFFPQLVAGPIERSGNLLHQIKEEHFFNYNQASYGVKLIALGLFKKIVVADNLSPYVDGVFGNIQSFHGFSLIIAIVFFAIQIYCDFSGYSDIARGSAKLLGIELMENFHSPNLSTSMKDYWNRWHISLSTWFKDYIYIPLGGSRCSKLRHYFNYMVTFLVSGLWHGASWMYIIWGGIHGVLQIIETELKIKPDKEYGTLKWFGKFLISFAVICFTLVFFRSQSVGDASYFLGSMFSGISHPYKYISDGIVQLGLRKIVFLFYLFVYILPLSIIDYYSLNHDIIADISAMKSPVKYMLYFFFVLIITLFSSTNNVSFVYFQF